VIADDSKLYEEDGRRFTVAQIEELTFSHFEEKREALLLALEEHGRRDGLFFAALLVTDINTQTSLLLVRGAEAFLAAIDYPLVAPCVWELAGIVSRKKQLVPYLLRLLSRTAGA
jgi:manganese-dependent inorganic pyrophosphatase